MRIFSQQALALVLTSPLVVLGFTLSSFASHKTTTKTTKSATTLYVSTSDIGLGPGQEEEDAATTEMEEKELVAGVDYEIPDHEAYRTSRRSKLDEKCDEWFGALLGDASTTPSFLGSLSEEARRILTTPVELKNDEMLPMDDPEWTPYVSTRLPWTPLTPAFGLEEYGLPIPRRNAETWRQFDVAGMVGTDYSGAPEGIGTDLVLNDDEVATYQETLVQKGAWLADDACTARLVYVNGRFCPQLSKTDEKNYYNLNNIDSASEEVKKCLGRLTDGFTDELAAPVPVGGGENDEEELFLTSYKKLSGPDHNMGDPTSQFAINVQQGTACFAALNTIRTGAVAHIHHPAGADAMSKPVLVVNAVTANGGVAANSQDASKGVACHPRALVIAEDGSNLSFVQSCVDMDANENDEPRPTLYNGYTQFFVKNRANVTHSYLEETGGIVTPGTELSDDALEEGELSPREVEAQRPALQDTHLEAVDAHVMGEDSSFICSMMGVGGSGRVRTALSVALLRPGAHATVNGFVLSGGAQRSDMKTNIQHVAQGTTSRQNQKNMVGGRATAAFRGRIRVEQSAQQTDSEQLSRTVLLSDRSRVWTVPSLEIIADDVKCTHGATVSDLSEEELFYLRSRGLNRALARNLLMYAFVGDVSSYVDPAMMSNVDSEYGFQKRVIQKLENLVPQGERAIKGEFQSV